MKFRQYIRTFYHPRKIIGCVFLCSLLGAIPAIQIHVQSRLVDAGVAGISGGAAAAFVPYLLAYIALLLFEKTISSFLQRNSEKHQITVGGRLDKERLNKANRVTYSITETQAFHDLLDKSEAASEQDSKCYKAMQNILTNSVRIASVLFVIWAVDIWAVLCVLVLLAVGVLLNTRLASQSDGFWGKYRENMRRTNYFASMMLQREFASERKLFAYDEEISSRFSDSFAKARKENAALGRGRLTIESIMQLFSVVYSVAVVLLLLRPLTAGSITIGVFTAVFYSSTGLQGKCNQLYDAIFALTGNFRQMQSYFAFMKFEEEQQDISAAPVSKVPSIEFVHVGFAYPGSDKPVLSDVSFRLEPGKHYALVGENGCGKTTLVKLMSGLYTPTHGEIRVDGKSLQELSREEKNQYFSVVFQDFYRYPLTVRENISMGTPNQLTDSLINDTFHALDFHPAVLNGSKGLDSDLMPLQKGGAGLSGGEWQKLAIARCVLSPAPVAILDEPNAALDPIAEAAVYRAYKEMLDDKTTLFISHRLGSVRMADEILVLRNGKIEATDNHQALMENCGYYADLFNTQRGLYYGE